MPNDEINIYCADWVLPVATRPLEGGAIRGESLKVRERLQARVRDGSVHVGAAESGWWHTATGVNGEETA